MRVQIIISCVLSLMMISCASRTVDLLSQEHVETVLEKVRKGEAGTYIKWQPLELTYKNYTGSPSIDDPAFEKIVEEKFDNGACKTYYTKYDKTSQAEVKRLADEEKDAEAMFELYLRTDGKLDPSVRRTALKHLESAARSGHLNAYLAYLGGHGSDAPADSNIFKQYIKLLDAFIDITPTAVIEVRETFAFGKTHDSSRYEELRQRLSHAGNYEWALLHASIGVRETNTKYSDNVTAVDCYCEAYFRGCPVNFKSQIKCETPE